MNSLFLSAEERATLWPHVADVIEHYLTRVRELPVTPSADPAAVRTRLSSLDFDRPISPIEAVSFAAAALSEFQVHTPHPRYFGLFNPASTTMGIAADALVSAFNPQLAAWSHSPFAVEAEKRLIGEIGAKFGYAADSIDGTFCSGGAEANQTAILTALTTMFPDYGPRGARACPAQPVLYVSAEGHHSFRKAARMCGIGFDAVREIPVDSNLRMRVDLLAAAISADRAQGLRPFLVCATAGTTNAGAIDPLFDLAGLSEQEGLWFHVDAAWGGAAALVPEYRHLLTGIERAQSITFDAHKFLSIPMGAGLYLTREPSILNRTFHIDTAYMPKVTGLDVIDPYMHSMQWSRRFIGLKLLLTIAVAGWSGYAEALRNQFALGQLLRDQLAARGWEIVNQTELPVVCFDKLGVDIPRTAARVVESGAAWISSTLVGGVADKRRPVLRACITNFQSTPEDVNALVDLLG